MANATFASLPAVAITVAPNAFTSCTTPEPIPPAAACTSTTSPACTRARLRIASQPSRYGKYIAAPSSKLIQAGSSWVLAALSRTLDA